MIAAAVPDPPAAGEEGLGAASLGAVRLRLFLTMWAVIALVVAATVVADQFLNLGSDASDQVVGGPDGEPAPGRSDTTTTTSPASTPVPAPGQLRVTGIVTALRIEGAVLDPRQVSTPLTISSNRGFGNGGELTLVEVDGATSSIVWDGGRPFVLSQGGPLTLDPGVLELTPEGLRLVLGGGVHRLTPGTYRLDTPVAVGTAGIATPRDTVTFDATAESVFEARGDAALPLGPDRSHHLVGPGRVHLEGTLEATDSTGSRPATAVDLVEGPFDVTLEPTPEGWRITAVLQGETTAS